MLYDEYLGDSLVEKTDEEVEELLLHCVAAKSQADYVMKIKKIEFPGANSEYSTTAMSLPNLYKKGLVFTHRFCKAAKILGVRADLSYLPRLYKSNGVNG